MSSTDRTENGCKVWKNEKRSGAKREKLLLFIVKYEICDVLVAVIVMFPKGL